MKEESTGNLIIRFTLLFGSIVTSAPTGTSQTGDIRTSMGRTVMSATNTLHQNWNMNGEIREVVEDGEDYQVVKVCSYVKVQKRESDTTILEPTETGIIVTSSSPSPKAMNTITTSPTSESESNDDEGGQGGKITLIVTLSVAALSILAVGSVVVMPILMRFCCKKRYDGSSLKRQISEKVNWVGCSPADTERTDSDCCTCEGTTPRAGSSTSAREELICYCPVHGRRYRAQYRSFNKPKSKALATMYNSKAVSFDFPLSPTGNCALNANPPNNTSRASNHSIGIDQSDILLHRESTETSLGDAFQDDVFSDNSQSTEYGVAGQSLLERLETLKRRTRLGLDSDGVVLRVSSTDADEHGFVRCQEGQEAADPEEQEIEPNGITIISAIYPGVEV